MSETRVKGAPPIVFISHASQDKDLARRIRDKLRAAGFETWLDEDRIPANAAPHVVRHHIIQGARNCSAAVILLTPAYEPRIWTQHEVGLLVAEGRLRDIPLSLVHDSVNRSVVGQFSYMLSTISRTRPGRDFPANDLSKVVQFFRTWLPKWVPRPAPPGGLFGMALTIGVTPQNSGHLVADVTVLLAEGDALARGGLALNAGHRERLEWYATRLHGVATDLRANETEREHSTGLLVRVLDQLGDAIQLSWPEESEQILEARQAQVEAAELLRSKPTVYRDLAWANAVIRYATALAAAGHPIPPQLPEAMRHVGSGLQAIRLQESGHLARALDAANRGDWSAVRGATRDAQRVNGSRPQGLVAPDFASVGVQTAILRYREAIDTGSSATHREAVVLAEQVLRQIESLKSRELVPSGAAVNHYSGLAQRLLDQLQGP